MNDELTYYDIEAYRNAPPPRTIDEKINQLGMFIDLSRAFPEYFPGGMTDEKLMRIIEEGEARRGMKKTLSTSS